MDDEIRDNEEMKMDNVESNDDTTKSADTEAVDDDAAAETSAPTKHSDYKPVNRFDASAVHHLSGDDIKTRKNRITIKTLIWCCAILATVLVIYIAYHVYLLTL